LMSLVETKAVQGMSDWSFTNRVMPQSKFASNSSFVQN